MALFTGSTLKKGTQSNTRLVVSGGDSPAEKWKVNPTLPKLFDYMYGGAGQKDVLISKGMMVAIDSAAPLVRDYDTNRYLTQLTVADGTNAVIGMAPYNLCREVDDRFTGNQPSVMTRNYVELPYFPSSEDAKKCLWGNVSGTIAPGDFVKVSTDPALKGRLVKWVDGADKVSQRCGQVLAKEPLGTNFDFLEWSMWNEAAKREDDAYINKSGYSAPGFEGYPFDPELYSKYGFSQDEQNYLSQYTTTPTGIPGLTDGENTANTVCERVLGIIANGTAKDATIAFLVEKNIIPDSVELSIGGVKVVDKSKIYINAATGIVKYTTEAPIADGDKTVSIKYKAKHYGIPEHMNFSGCDGVVRILLGF